MEQLDILEDSFLECNLKVCSYRFIPKPRREENGWVSLELKLSPVTGFALEADVLICLNHVIEWDDEATGDFFDLWNPNYDDAVEDGSGISYPLYSVLKSGLLSDGEVVQTLFCPETVMKHPSKYRQSARKKGGNRNQDTYKRLMAERGRRLIQPFYYAVSRVFPFHSYESRPAFHTCR